MPLAGSVPAWDVGQGRAEPAGKSCWDEGFGAGLSDCGCHSWGSGWRSFGVPPSVVTAQP